MGYMTAYLLCLDVTFFDVPTLKLTKETKELILLAKNYLKKRKNIPVHCAESRSFKFWKYDIEI